MTDPRLDRFHTLAESLPVEGVAAIVRLLALTEPEALDVLREALDDGGGFSEALAEAILDLQVHGGDPGEFLRAWRDGQRLRAGGHEVDPLDRRLEALREAP